MNIKLKDNHFLFSCSSEFREICSPLLKHSCINYVDYGCFHFKNPTFYGLSTLGIMAKPYFENPLYPTEAEFKGLQKTPYVVLSPDIELPSGFERNKFRNNIQYINDCGTTHRFYLLNITEDYAEHYGFGTSSSVKSATQFFINNIDVFEKFVFYLQSKASKLFEEAKKNPVKLLHFSQELKINSEDIPLLDLLEKAIENSQKNNQFNLTSREIHILSKIAEGWTYKEIAIYLNISRRTVETHVQNIKTKTSSFRKTQLRELGKHQALSS